MPPGAPPIVLVGGGTLGMFVLGDGPTNGDFIDIDWMGLCSESSLKIHETNYKKYSFNLTRVAIYTHNMLPEKLAGD